MIAVDTNVIVRLLTNDDKNQFKKSFALFESNEIYISLTVLQEAEWVLRFSYEYPPDQINDSFRKLLGLENVTFDFPLAVKNALDWHRKGLDFSDALHLSQCKGCQALYTFDKSFINKSKQLKSTTSVTPP